MFYKYNSFGGRLAASEAQAAYQPQAFNSLKVASPGPVIGPVGAAKGGLSQHVNKIIRLQSIFQTGEGPVHLRSGAKDLVTYRGAMGLSLVGLSITFFALFQMATGRMKKKEK